MSSYNPIEEIMHRLKFALNHGDKEVVIKTKDLKHFVEQYMRLRDFYDRYADVV